MRTFIALPLNDQVHQGLGLVQQRLKVCDADIRWVEPSNIHLTLKFLGDISPDQSSGIKESLNALSVRHKQFTITIKGIGAFPKPSFPRIIWAGIEAGRDECIALANDIDSSMKKLGFAKEERPFSPHLTLGRVRSPKNKDKLALLIEKEKDLALQSKVLAETIILFESTLTPKGSIYTPIQEFRLAL